MSKFIDIEVDRASLAKVNASIKSYGVDAAKALMRGLWRGALNIETDAKLRLDGRLGSARHWVTGRLASSVHSEVKGDNSFTPIPESGTGDGSFGIPMQDLEVYVGTNVNYGPKIEFEYDSFINFSVTKNTPKLSEYIEKELNKITEKFNK